jgi:hypothetical protein
MILKRTINETQPIIQISPIDKTFRFTIREVLQEISKEIRNPKAINYPKSSENPAQTLIIELDSMAKETVDNLIEQGKLTISSFEYMAETPIIIKPAAFNCNYNIIQGDVEVLKQSETLQKLQDEISNRTKEMVKISIKPSTKGEYIQVTATNVKTADRLRDGGLIYYQTWLIDPWLPRKDKEKRVIQNIVETALKDSNIMPANNNNYQSNPASDEKYNKLEERQLAIEGKIQALFAGQERIDNGFKEQDSKLQTIEEKMTSTQDAFIQVLNTFSDNMRNDMKSCLTSIEKRIENIEHKHVGKKSRRISHQEIANSSNPEDSEASDDETYEQPKDKKRRRSDNE